MMDETSRSIVSQVCIKATAEVYAALCDVSQGFQPELFDTIYKHAWQTHAKTMNAVAAPPPGEPGPFDQGQPTAPQPAVQQPVPQSPPPVQPSPQPVPAQPQPVMAGPPCPNCGTPMAQTKDYVAKKARNLSEGKKPPPMWKCPMGSWTPKTGAQGCQGCQFEEAMATQ